MFFRKALNLQIHKLRGLENRLSFLALISPRFLIIGVIFLLISSCDRQDNQTFGSTDLPTSSASPTGSPTSASPVVSAKKAQPKSASPVVSVKKAQTHFSPSLGTGLSGIAEWSTQFPFLDDFKSSRQWITQCEGGDPGCSNDQWDTNESKLLNLDKDGWVKSLPAPSDRPKYTKVSTLLLRDIPGLYPSGRYVVLYQGEGTISYNFDAKKDEAASTPGRDVLDVNSKGGGGILITISSTDPKKTGNYIRNIRVVKAADEALYTKGEIFSPAFLKKIKNFRTIRFMDWMQTNGSQQKEWSSRPRKTSASYALKGAPLEVMIALSNKSNAAPWFNMPHMANDEYMTKFAQVVKEELNPKLKVYVEFSNEVWNWQFPQANYALQQGQARWGKDKGDAHMQWYGMRAAQMCDIWKKTFATQKERVVCVMGTQTAWEGLEKAALDCPEWVAEGNKPCYQHGIDAYAIAGYFGGSLGSPENTSTVESWLKATDGGFGKAFQQLRKGGLLKDSKDSLADVYKSFNYHAGVARERGLQLVAYEGGQHIVGHSGVENNEKLTNFFIKLNRHPEMYDLYTQLLDDWQKAGGGVFMHFVDIGVPGKWGSWGALEYLGQNGSPKYNALMEFERER